MIELPTVQPSHDQLWRVCRQREGDYEPWGDVDYDSGDYHDCSCGCRYYARLNGPRAGDWGVCWNPDSHRFGLLTFEHQGCPEFVMDEKLEAEIEERMEAADIDREER